MMLIDGFTEATEGNMTVHEVLAQIHQLQTEIDEIFKSSQKNCNTSVTYDDAYERVVSEFLKQNFTNIGAQLGVQKNETDKSNVVEPKIKDESFITRLKNKIASIVSPKKVTNGTEPRVKRCLNGLTEAEIQIEDEKVNFDTLNVEELQGFLKSLIECLQKASAKKEQANNHEHEIVASIATVTSGNDV